MKLNGEQVIQGIVNYADNEVMAKLPTSGKWVMGTAMYLASNKAHNVVDVLSTNVVAKMLGIVDDEGMIDTDALISAMKEAASKYGNLSVDVPMIGRLTFSSSDIDNLSMYMR